MGGQQKYSDELKAEAVRMVIRDGMAQTEVGRKLGISHKSINTWVTQYINKENGNLEGTPSLAELVGEVKRLRKELAESKMEAEILKKATAYFAKESLPGMRS